MGENEGIVANTVDGLDHNGLVLNLTDVILEVCAEEGAGRIGVNVPYEVINDSETVVKHVVVTESVRVDKIVSDGKVFSAVEVVEVIFLLENGCVVAREVNNSEIFAEVERLVSDCLKGVGKYSVLNCCARKGICADSYSAVSHSCGAVIGILAVGDELKSVGNSSVKRAINYADRVGDIEGVVLSLGFGNRYAAEFVVLGYIESVELAKNEGVVAHICELAVVLGEISREGSKSLLHECVSTDVGSRGKLCACDRGVCEGVVADHIYVLKACYGIKSLSVGECALADALDCVGEGNCGKLLSLAECVLAKSYKRGEVNARHRGLGERIFADLGNLIKVDRGKIVAIAECAYRDNSDTVTECNGGEILTVSKGIAANRILLDFWFSILVHAPLIHC